MGDASVKQKINLGVSAGISYQYKRMIFDAGYLKSISGPKVSSGFGGYAASYGTFQLSIGFQLDQVK